MNKHVAFFAIAILAFGTMGAAHAHKDQIVGDYKVEVGWKHEPPVAGVKNAIEIVVTKASQSEKDASASSEHDSSHGPDHSSMDEKAHAHKEMKKDGISGLRKTLEADVTLDGKKTFLKLLESKTRHGYYYGTYVPGVDGYPTAHVVGKIHDTPIEITFHPEKVEATKQP